MQKLISLYVLLVPITLFCSDNEMYNITSHHQRIAQNNMQLHTTPEGRIVLKALARARFTVLAQACTDYITGLTLYNSSNISLQDRQQLSHALQCTQKRILSDPQTQDALFQIAQKHVLTHIELLPELQPYIQTFEQTRQEKISNMSAKEYEQYNTLWYQLNEEFKQIYITTLQKGLLQAQEAVEQGVTNGCIVS